MRIVVDENIPAAEVFSRHGDLTVLPGRSMSTADVREADALIVRSVTRVNAELLQGSRVRFVGTCTIGTDHLDTDWLEARGIGWSNAPGCNARAVVEYVLAALRLLAIRRRAVLAQRTFGIVGAGEVGQRLANLMTALGWQVLLCDPPRQHGGRQPGVAGLPGQQFVGLDELVQRCDVLCLHTPLTHTGSWPTYHLLDEVRLRRLRPDCWLINAGRGPVVNNVALLHALTDRPDVSVVLDVWEHEPQVDVQLAALCELVTPHIAGYSLDGKIRGTEMVYRAFCRHFELDGEVALDYPPAEIAALTLGERLGPEQLLLCLAGLFYEPLADDAALRATLVLEPEQQKQAFDRLRKEYPVRREMQGTCLYLPAQNQALEQVAKALQMPWQVISG